MKGSRTTGLDVAFIDELHTAELQVQSVGEDAHCSIQSNLFMLPRIQWGSAKAATALWACFGVVLVFVTYGILAYPKAVDWDGMQGILAASQYELGRSPSLVTVVSADPRDLSKDLLLGVGHWPPGYQVVPFFFHSMGISWGLSLKIVVLICTFVGLAGWGYYLSLFRLPAWLLPALLLSLLCSSYTVGSVTVYGAGNLLLWAFAPLLIVANVAALTKANEPQRPLACAMAAMICGVGATGVFLLKYNGLFVGIGLGAAWLWSFAYRRTNAALFCIWLLGATIGGAVIKLAGFPWGTTPASSMGVGFHWIEAFLSMGIWPTAMPDFSALVEQVCEWTNVSFAARGWVHPLRWALDILPVIYDMCK